MAIPLALSAKFEGTYAYFTVRDRLPTYLTKIINLLCQEKAKIAEKYGPESFEESKEIIGKLSEMKSNLQTNKPIKPNHKEFDSKHGDSFLWNEDIEAYEKENGCYPKWFTASWIFVECYFYKKIHNIFQTSKVLHNFDPFRYQKEAALQNSLHGVKSIAKFALEAMENLKSDQIWLNNKVSILVQLSLWGNQCDLSHPNMDYEHQSIDPVESLAHLAIQILHSDMDELLQYLHNVPPSKRHVAIILDNAGFELVADLILMTFLMETKMVTNFSIYPKTRPYFISDTMTEDFFYTLEQLKKEGEIWLQFDKLWHTYLKNERWKIQERKFWTTGRVYSSMKEKDPDLYQELSNHSLLIFKGDLNYRKLTADLDWPHDTPLKEALRGFLPCPLLTLRTIKGGPVVGVDTLSSNYLKAKREEKWDASGNYGLIQFVPSL